MCFLRCLTLITRRSVYHGTAAICISIDLYEIVQLRSGDGVALPFTLTVGVVGLTLRGGPLIRSYFIKQKPKNLLRGLFAN